MTVGTVPGMSYPSDLTDDQWAPLEPVFNAAGKRGRKHTDDLRTVVDALLYIAQTGCQWRYLPASFGRCTRVRSQFRRWSQWHLGAGTDGADTAARAEDGRANETPSMVAVDVLGLPVAALVVLASTHENRASELMLEHLSRQGVTNRLQLVPVDRGVTAAAGRTRSALTTTSRSAGWGGTTSSRSSAQSGMPGAWRSPTAVSDAPAGCRSRLRTPPCRLQAGSVSRASPRRCATCHESEPAAFLLRRSQLDHPPSRTAPKMRHEPSRNGVLTAADERAPVAAI